MKITFYDNKVTAVSAAPTGKANEYRVSLTVEVGKVYIDDHGDDLPASGMNDYIDIGVFGEHTMNAEGRFRTNPLYLKKYKLTAGRHVITMIVQGKPLHAGIDPYNKLIDRRPNDNYKDF
jgi:ABC-2 type transport system permease protein